MAPMISAVMFILQSLLYLGVMMLLLRFLVQAMRADYYNPLVSAVIKVTDPVTSIVRAVFRVISPKRFDLASLIVAWVFATVHSYLLLGLPILESINDFTRLAIHSTFVTVNTFFDLYFFFFIVIVITSWVGAQSHPAVTLLNQLVGPILEPLRRLIPSVSGLDFSVLIAILTLLAIQRHILPALQASLLA